MKEISVETKDKLLIDQMVNRVSPPPSVFTRTLSHFSGSDQAESTLSGPEAVQFSTVWSAERLIWRGSGVTDLRSLTRVQTSSFHSPALPGALLVLCNLRTRSALLNVLLPNLFNSEFIMMHLISTFSNRTQCSELVLHLEKCSFTRNQT